MKDSHIEKKGKKIVRPKEVTKKVVHVLAGIEKHVVGLKPTFFKFFGRLGHWTRRTVKLLIPFAVLLFFTFVPLGIEMRIQYVLGVLFCIAIMWAFESLPLPVTSLLAPTLLVLYGVFPTAEDAFAPFAFPVVYLILGSLIIAEAFRKNGIDKRLSLYLISKSKGKFKWLLLAIMIGAAVLSMWISNTATAALLIPVTIGIAKRVSEGKKERHAMARLLLLGVGVSTIIGGMATIIGSSPNAVTSGFLAARTTWTFVDWMIIGVPLSMILLFISWAILLRFFPCEQEVVDISWVEEERKKLGPLSHDQRKVLIIFGGIVFFWLTGGRFASLFPVPVPGGFADAAIVAALGAVLMFVTRALDWEDAKLIPWGLFLIVGAGLSLGQGLMVSGGADWLAGEIALMSNFLRVLGPLVYLVFLLLIISFLGVALSNFMNNTAAAAVIVPIMISMAGALNVSNIKIVVLPVAFSLVLSFVTPVATPSSTLVYGSGMVSRKDLAVSGVLISVPSIIIAVIFCYLVTSFGVV